MPSFKLALTLAAAAYAIGKYLFSGKDDEDPPPPPPHDSYYSSSLYNSGTTRTQTQQSYRPPPPSASYTYRPPATNARSQTTARTPASPVCSCGVYHPSVVSPYTRTPSQSQPSSNAHSQNTPRTSAPHDYGRGVYHSSVASPYTRTPSQTQPSSNSHSQTTPWTSVSPDYGRGVRHSSVASPYTRTLSQTQPSSTRTQASRQYSSLFDTVRVDEPPEYESFQTCSCVPSRVHTACEPPLPTTPTVVSSDPLSDEPAGVEDLDFAKKLRERARRKGREMSEARSRAKSARKKGHLGAAHAHGQEAIAHESEMKELDKRAAKIFFRENNKVSS